MNLEPLPQPFVERRIPLRLLAYWEKLRDGREMPSESDVVPDDIRDLWDNCFIIHLKDVKSSNYRYSYLGRKIIEAYRSGISDNSSVESMIPSAGMLDGYVTVQKTHKPLIEAGEFSTINNHPVRYRQCLLPLGDGKEVKAILGALHMKVFPK
jgi:hypothetical protein